MGCFQTGGLFVIECFAPDHKHNDWELTFSCIPALGSGTQLIRAADNHCALTVPTATFKALKCFCLFGLWPKIQATRYAGGR
jgi:hypothetical protein